MITNQKSSHCLERRRFWSNQVEVFYQSGMGAQEFCSAKGIGYSTFCAWRRKLNLAQKGAAGLSTEKIAIPVFLAESDKRRSANQSCVRIAIGGFEMTVTSACAPEWVAAVLIAFHAKRRGKWVRRC